MERILENKIEIEKPKWKRMPITIENDGKKENVWVNYIVEMKPMTGTCIECGLENQEMPCENVKEVKVESDDIEIIKQATEKIAELVRICEQKMFVCKKCFDSDFITKRKELYIRALEEAQEELGIKIDKEMQRKIILED